MRHILTSLAVVTTLIAFDVPAQQCQLSDTPLECWARFNPAPTIEPTAAADASADVAQKVVADANTGITSIVSPSESALKDFLSLLSASLESATLKDSGQTLTFDYNPPGKILNAEHALKLQAVFGEAKLNDQLIQHLGTNAAAAKTFQDSLDSLDNVTLSATLQPTSRRWGRSIGPFRVDYRTLSAAVLPSTAKSDFASAKAIQAAGISSSNQDTPFSAFTVPDLDNLGETKPMDLAGQRNAMKLIEVDARRFKAEGVIVDRFTSAFARLLNNQSQIYASFAHHSRKNIVGPNEWTMKVTYEMGKKNLSSFFAGQKECINAKAAAAAAECVTSLEEYAPPADANQDRVAFAVEYHRVNRRWINGLDDNFEFGYARVQTLVGSLTYGRTVGGVLNNSTGRIDLSGKYERPQHDDSEADLKRGAIVSLTYTQKLNDKLSIPIALIYADHSSNLSNVNRRFNTHFGLLYKLPSK
jgi:hypothetical protein